jgi:hypothetical protein
MSYSEYYGRGSTKARVCASEDFLAVILEETFTPAEKTLIARGGPPGSRTFAAVSAVHGRSVQGGRRAGPVAPFDPS